MCGSSASSSSFPGKAVPGHTWQHRVVPACAASAWLFPISVTARFWVKRGSKNVQLFLSENQTLAPGGSFPFKTRARLKIKKCQCANVSVSNQSTNGRKLTGFS